MKRLGTSFSIKLLSVSCAMLLSALAFTIGCNKSEQTSTTTTSTDSSTHNSSAPSSTTTTTTTPADSSKATPPAGITGKAAEGQKIYYNTSYGKVKVACASCHVDGQPTTNDTRLRPGHTLVGVSSRTSTWNGQITGADLPKNAYGATICAVMYQHKGDNLATVIGPADIDALNAYFDAIKSAPGGMTTNLKIQWVTKPALHDNGPVDDKAANAAAKAIIKLPGDPTAGKTVFDRTCAYCHTMKDKKVGPPFAEAMKQPIQGARAARAGSNAMPFYAYDLLTDQQISDVIAYIQQSLGK